MLRGNNRKNIFLKEDDYQNFLKIIVNAADAYNFKVHLYCLMTNHIHLVIEVGDIPISRIMQSIASRYARVHNKKYDKIGHLFQGRFKSKLITDDHYLLELCYYIHMNPVKAKMCKSIDEYKWSSHHGYQSQKNIDCFKTDYIRQIISGHFDDGTSYHQFISNYSKGNFKPLFCKFNDDGSLDILNVVGAGIQNKPSLALENISLTVITKIVCEQLQVSLDSIASENLSKRVSIARSMIAYFAHYHAKYTYHDIAAVLCRQPASVSSTLRRHLKLAATDREIKSAMASVERLLSMSDIDRWAK